MYTKPLLGYNEQIVSLKEPLCQFLRGLFPLCRTNPIILRNVLYLTLCALGVSECLYVR